MRDIGEEIEELTRRRQAILSKGGGEPGEVERIGRLIAALYEERRAARARDSSGISRDEIVRRARLEGEIERLMSG